MQEVLANSKNILEVVDLIMPILAKEAHLQLLNFSVLLRQKLRALEWESQFHCLGLNPQSQSKLVNGWLQHASDAYWDFP